MPHSTPQPYARAAIDCGTNAIRLLIVDKEYNEICRLNTIVRLGQDVDATGVFAPEALERVRTALTNYASIMRTHNVHHHEMVATSATRDAKNKEEFFTLTEEILGTPATVISGEEEAALSYTGATAHLPATGKPYCVIDLGGGSTEYVTATGAISTTLGCVRLTERFGTNLEAMRRYTDEQLSLVSTTIDCNNIGTLVGVGGTFTTIAALALNLDTYDESKLHATRLPFDKIRTTTTDLLAQTPAQRLTDPRIIAGREDVIAAGCIIIEQTLNFFENKGHNALEISIHDILDGIIAKI